MGVERPSFFMEIIAYTSPGCFYCEQLKELFSRANVEYNLVVVDTMEERQQFKEKFPNAIGYPHVIIDDEEYPGIVPVAKLFLQKGLVSSPKK
jgi:glutaredoxin 3